MSFPLLSREVERPQTRETQDPEILDLNSWTGFITEEHYDEDRSWLHERGHDRLSVSSRLSAAVTWSRSRRDVTHTRPEEDQRTLGRQTSNYVAVTSHCVENDVPFPAPLHSALANLNCTLWNSFLYTRATCWSTLNREHHMNLATIPLFSSVGL